MRRWMAITACLGIGLISAAAAWADAARPAPEILVLGNRGVAAPTILRGSTAAPRRTAAVQPRAPTEIVGGQRLWVVDRATGEVRGCRDRDTSTVGVREIRCTSGDIGRYRRAFGRGFRP